MDTAAAGAASGGSSITDALAEHVQVHGKGGDGALPGSLWDDDTDVDRFQRSQDVPVRDAVSGRDAKGSVPKRLTLTFKDVTVRVMASGTMLGETLLSRVDPRVIFSKRAGEQRVSMAR